MQYDFTTLPDRTRSNAEKFVNMHRLNPEVAPDVIPFSVADMDFLPPPELVEGLKEYVGSTIFGYTLPSDSYYNAILDWMGRRHGLDIPREWLVDADNVIAALRQMIQAYTAPTDGIVVLTPAYPAFLSSVAATGRQLLECPLVLGKDGYTIDFARLEELCRRPDATLMVFCNPHNPVGRVWTRAELEQVAEICLREGVFLVSDEIHWDLILPGASFTSMASLEPRYQRNCAVSTACTKTFNLAGLKGAVVIMADPARRDAFLARNGVSGRDMISYAAWELAYRRCEGWLDQLLGVLAENRTLMADFFHSRLPQVGVIPLEGTYLQWLDFRFLGMEAKEQEQFMARQAQCFFTEGYKFGAGGAGFERWNIACPRQTLLAGLERMERAVCARQPQ